MHVAIAWRSSTVVSYIMQCKAKWSCFSQKRDHFMMLFARAGKLLRLLMQFQLVGLIYQWPDKTINLNLNCVCVHTYIYSFSGCILIKIYCAHFENEKFPYVSVFNPEQLLSKLSWCSRWWRSVFCWALIKLRVALLR